MSCGDADASRNTIFVTLWLYRFMMEAFVRPQNRRRLLEKHFDYLALVPAAAAICYPFLLNAFHAIVGMQAVSPPPLAIAGATFILVVAFVVPFLGMVFADLSGASDGRDARPAERF